MAVTTPSRDDGGGRCPCAAPSRCRADRSPSETKGPGRPWCSSTDGADRSPHGQARRLAELLVALDLTDVTLVGNDSGGAISQLLVATDPSRVGRLLLTNCDAFEVFPPPAFRWLVTLARWPRVMALVSHLLAWFPILARSPTAFGRLARRRIPSDVLAGWTAPGADPRIRRDIAGMLGAVTPRTLIDAVPGLRRFDRPVRLAWGTSDPFFSCGLAERLAATFPRATLSPIHDCGTFVPLDAPDRLADEIAAFAALERARAASA